MTSPEIAPSSVDNNSRSTEVSMKMQIPRPTSPISLFSSGYPSDAFRHVTKDPNKDKDTLDVKSEDVTNVNNPDSDKEERPPRGSPTLPEHFVSEACIES